MVAGASTDDKRGSLGIGVEVFAAFGSHCGGDVRDAALFGDANGQYIVHPIGRHMAFRHIDSGEANYAQETRRVESITACATSPDKSLLAVCERCTSEPHTQVSVYELHAAGTKPARTLEEIGVVGLITCAAFSSPQWQYGEDDDGAGQDVVSLLCLASVIPNDEEPEHLLVVLDWRANLVLGKCSLNNSLSRVAFSPLDNELLAVSGSDYLGLWTTRGGELQPLPDFQDEALMEGTAFLDHAWLEPGDGRFLACTAESCLLFVNSADQTVVGTIDAPFQGAPDDVEATVVCMRCFDRGFAVGGPSGLVAVWLLTDDDNLAMSDVGVDSKYRHVCTARARQTEAPVCCLDVAGESEELKLLFGFGDANIGYISMDSLQGSHGKKSECTVLAGGFHSMGITGLCIAAHRPVIVSISQQECALRVWNYAAQCCELLHDFQGEEPNGVVIHPLGFFLVVSFSDKLRFLQILATELLPYREIALRGAKCPCFSYGGHLLAVAQGKLVLIFDTTTLAKVATIRGLSQQVASLSFSSLDETLTVMGDDGALAEYCTHTWTKTYDQSSRTSEAICSTPGDDGYVWCGLVEGQRCVVRSFKHCGPEVDDEVQLPDGTRPLALAQLRLASSVAILIGTSSGTLWTCSDLKESVPVLDKHSLHTGACTAVCLSADGCMAVTAGEDGTIFLLSVSDAVSVSSGSHSQPGVGAKKRGASTDGDVVMINHGDIQVGHEELEALTTENAALQTQLGEEEVRLQAECRARVSEARKKDQEEILELRERYEMLQQTATSKERESLRVMKAMEAKHIEVADKMEFDFDKKIGAETDRYVALETELIQLEVRIEAMRDEAARQLEVQHQQHSNELMKRVSEKDAEIKKLKDLIEFTQHRYDTMLDQEGIFHDLEVADLKNQCQAEIEQQRLIEYKLKKEQDTLLRGLDTMEKDREQAAKEQEETALIKSNLDRQLMELTQQAEVAKQERREREAVLREKELEIGAYKLKVSTLNKFKHVLDFRLREVTLSLQPKDQMIGHLNAQLRELEAEFERQLMVHRNMEKVSSSKSEQVSELETQNKRWRLKIKEREKRITSFNNDLHELVNKEQDLRKWPQGIIQIYKEHVQNSLSNNLDDVLPMEELKRQIGVVERKVSALSVKGKRDEVDCRNDVQQKTHDNSLLIQELSELRMDSKALNRDVKNLELKVRQAETKIAQENEAAEAAAAAAAILDAQGPGGAGAGGGTAEALEGMFSDRVTGAKTPPPPGTTLTAQVRASRPKSMRATMEQRKQMQKLLMQADISSQEIEMHALENKILRDQVAKLMKQAAVPKTQDQPRLQSTQSRKRTSTELGYSADFSSEGFDLGGLQASDSTTSLGGSCAGGGLSAVRGGRAAARQSLASDLAA